MTLLTCPFCCGAGFADVEVSEPRRTPVGGVAVVAYRVGCPLCLADASTYWDTRYGEGGEKDHVGRTHVDG